MAFSRGIDGADPARADGRTRPVEVQEDRRRALSWRLGTGTLACPACDAPVALGGHALAPGDRLGCPYCGHGGAVRDFLSLAEPSRPMRVEVRIVRRNRRALS